MIIPDVESADQMGSEGNVKKAKLHESGSFVNYCSSSLLKAHHLNVPQNQNIHCHNSDVRHTRCVYTIVSSLVY